ncbi:probable helicase CHR10 isoform X1 [Spinacia oleracea]|uniref:Probable helicase CHR10 isoform X1 n=2 Tax=Spinacia oleracea TaxID=3562 RepID=A0ABM3RCW7_SPIOL|nr:probable helicase CHR10 isoform X1 [Spinacia oleracea]
MIRRHHSIAKKLGLRPHLNLIKSMAFPGSSAVTLSASTLFLMGLGKTLQAITFLCYLKFCKGSPGPFLVLCPLSVIDGWVSEIEKFAPKLRVLSYVGEKEHRRRLRRTMYEHVQAQSSSNNVSLLPFDVLLTTYDIALIDQDFLSQFQWHYTVIDEAQRLKNSSSVLYGVLKERYIMPRRLLMTGTPIQNNLTELWALMHFCMPSVFGTLEQFLQTFKAVGDASAGHDGASVKEQLNTLKCLLGAFMLRRTKSKLVECGTLVLPPLTEITVMVPLVALQKSVYTSILRKELPRLLALSSGTSNVPSLQNVVVQLRKACSHPYLFPGIEPEPYEEGEHLVQASGKLMILDQLLRKLHESGHRVLLFAQMTQTLDILQDYLELRRYSYERLDGSIRAEERFAAIRNFSHLSTSGNKNTESSEQGAFVFLISTRAGGVGLNLMAADTVVFYEQDWNPQVDRQALQRAHRIGQMNHVLSINLVTGRSIEEVILQRARKKLQLSHNVIDDEASEHVGKELSGAGPGDLKSMIYGLRFFDPEESSKENSSEPKLSELDTMAAEVLAKRNEKNLDEETEKFALSSISPSGNDFGMERAAATINVDPGLDEASYRSWVEKFKEVAESIDKTPLELESRRVTSEEKVQRLEAAKKKAEEKKLAKWQTLGYQSLSVPDPTLPVDSDLISERGAVNFVFGDCTNPSDVCPSEPTIIFSCVDDSGNWGRGGLFDALARLSSKVPEAYERASECGDLHLGDLHLIQIDDVESEQIKDSGMPWWVALAVVQSYNPRRKVPRSSISISDLDLCLSKASSAAAQNSASIHMPRVGYQDGSDRAIWYSTERLLRKYSSIYGIKIYVYYYRKPSG